MRQDAVKVEAGNRIAKEASKRAAARNESILAFAERHGWEVGDGDTSDYFTDVRISKGSKFVDLVLWQGLRKDVAQARTHTGTVCVKVPDPVRPRIERFIVGVECDCVIKADWLAATSEYESPPAPTCPVHGHD